MFKLPLETLCNNRISVISKVTVLDVSFRGGAGGGEAFLTFPAGAASESADINPPKRRRWGKESRVLCGRCYVSRQCEANIELRLAQHAMPITEEG